MNDSPYSRPEMAAVFDRIACAVPIQLAAQDLVSIVALRNGDCSTLGREPESLKKAIQPAG